MQPATLTQLQGHWLSGATRQGDRPFGESLKEQVLRGEVALAKLTTARGRFPRARLETAELLLASPSVGAGLPGTAPDFPYLNPTAPGDFFRRHLCWTHSLYLQILIAGSFNAIDAGF